jgi:hypothetical protein
VESEEEGEVVAGGGGVRWAGGAGVGLVGEGVVLGRVREAGAGFFLV